MKVILLLVAFAGTAAADVPRGKRTPAPRPTQVVVQPTRLAAGALSAEVAAGVGVLAGQGGEVVLAAPVELHGKIDRAALGQRIVAETPVYSADGREVVGRALPGALVRPAGAARGGRVPVDTVGPVRARVAVAQGMLTAEPRLLVLPVVDGALASAAADSELHADAGAAGPVRARLQKGAPIVVLEKNDRAAHVRTYGDVQIEGWLPVADVGPPIENALARPPAPTHEVLVDTALFSAQKGGKRVGTLHGGVLVTVEPGDPSEFVQVSTLGEVEVDGWARAADLRPVDRSVWVEGP